MVHNPLERAAWLGSGSLGVCHVLLSGPSNPGDTLSSMDAKSRSSMWLRSTVRLAATQCDMGFGSLPRSLVLPPIDAASSGGCNDGVQRRAHDSKTSMPPFYSTDFRQCFS